MPGGDVHKSFCRICVASCGIDVTVLDGQVVNVAADRDHPMSRGYMCVKGRQLASQVHARDRLTSSLRRGPTGELEPVGTAAAIAEVGTRLRDIAAEHGPGAIATFTGTAAYGNAAGPNVVRAWHAAVGSHMNFTTLTIDQPSKILAVGRIGVWGGGGQSFATSDVAMLVGNNPAVSGLHTPGGPPGYHPSAIGEARRRGLKLIVVDPRRTEAAAQSDIHLQLRPGEDPTVLAGLLRVILAEGLHDAAFCHAHVKGLDGLRMAVDPFTSAYVETRAGVAAADLEAAARTFAAGPRGMVSSGTGPDMAPRPNLSEHLICCLNYVCGRVGREGDAVDYPSILTPLLPRPAQVFPPELLPPDLNPAANADRLRVRNFRRVYGEMPTPGLADEILTPGDGQVRALIVTGANPVLAIPDQQKVVKAFEQLDLLVTLDIRPTETTRMSDYVIACRHALERADLPSYQDMFFDAAFSQFTDAVVDPPGAAGDVVEEWRVFAGLARAMGRPLVLGGVEVDDDAETSTMDVLSLLYADAKVPVAEIARHPGGRVFDEIDVRVGPPIEGIEARLDLDPVDGDGRVLDDLAAVAAEAFSADGSYGPGGAYTHLLTCRRLKHVANTVGRDFPATLERGATNPAFVHPDDLAGIGAPSGALVRVESEHGEIDAVVEADPTVRPGVISMSHGFGSDPSEPGDVRRHGSTTSRLVSVDDHVDPVLGMARQSAIPVRVHLIEGQA
ncbi:MAG: molybdopterin-dependent oxidoreductase [Acidimicrobiia bacterium]|nr:molybdopterin-dependent oxidoreductase [Acidimicrobiia bacterium]